MKTLQVMLALAIVISTTGCQRIAMPTKAPNTLTITRYDEMVEGTVTFVNVKSVPLSIHLETDEGRIICNLAHDVPIPEEDASIKVYGRYTNPYLLEYCTWEDSP